LTDLSGIPEPLRSSVRDRPGGVFFLYGDDEFRKEAAARALVAAHLDSATRDFNFDPLRGSEMEVEAFASHLATPPMMAEWRVLLLREAEVLATQPRARDLVLAAVDDPPPGLALILLTTIPDRSKARFYQDLKSRARALEFAAISAADVPGWLMEQAKAAHGVAIAPDAARALAVAVGTDLGILDQELEKLSALAGDAGEITFEVVEAAGIRLPEQDRWRWFDLVGERRFREALAAVPVLLAQGETGVGLTIGLGTHLLRLGVALEGGRGALEKVLPPHQRWLARQYPAQAGGWSSPGIESALSDLGRMDRLLKASGFSDEHLLEEWLLRRMGEGTHAAA
jgi:DNA polymerase III subunit delta